jgi:hypothetical protein
VSDDRQALEARQGQDAARGLIGAADDIAVCGADAPNTYPMDKTVEVSQAAREMLAGLGNLREQFAQIASMHPNDQPHYPSGVRPFGTGDLRHVIETLDQAIAALATRATQPEAALREALTVELLAFALDISAGNPASTGPAVNAAIALLERNGIEPRERGLFFHSRDADLNDAAAALKDHRHG